MAGIPLLISGIITIILLLFANKNKDYKTESKDMDVSFKGLIPIGMLIVDKIGVEKFKRVNKAIYEKMVSIYGIKVEVNFRAHIANKIMLSILAIDAVNFIILANGEFSVISVIGGPIAGIAMYILSDSIQQEKFKVRIAEIKYYFPEFITKLVLLVNAGLNFERAWEKILEDEKQSNALIQEMNITLKDIKSNISMNKCLNDLSRRCKVQEINKFTSIVLQNISKGSSDMVIMLQQLSDECWIERKLIARQKGEEASSKLLLPMMLMLVTVFIIIMVPAMMSMFNV